MAITLGKLIRLLEAEKQDNAVRFDFGGFVPAGIHSWRGRYDELAVGFKEYSEPAETVADFIKRLRAEIGQIHTGWKGGEYMMDEDAPLWADNPGECSNTAIKGIADCRWTTVIVTEFED